MEYHAFRPVLLSASHDHFQLAHWQVQSGQRDPSLRLKAYDKSSLSYKAEQITIVPSDNIQGYRLQIHDPNPQTSPIFLIGHAYRRCFQRSIWQGQPDAQWLHFQQVSQKHPNPSVVILFHLLNDENG